MNAPPSSNLSTITRCGAATASSPPWRPSWLLVQVAAQLVQVVLLLVQVAALQAAWAVEKAQHHRP